MIMSKLPILSVNEFKKPKVLEGVDSDIQLIYYIMVGRGNSSVVPDLKYNIDKYRFENIENSKSQIESTLRDHITKVAPAIYLDSIDIVQINSSSTRVNKTLHFTINVINQANNQRSSIFFKITKKDQTHLLVELIN